MLNNYPDIFRDVVYPEDIILDSPLTIPLVILVVLLVVAVVFMIYRRTKK